MSNDSTSDVRSKSESAVEMQQPAQLTINVLFQDLPIVSYTDKSSGEPAMKRGAPFIRFPVNLTAEDSAVLKNILSSARIGMICFEIQESNGETGFYRAVLASE